MSLLTQFLFWHSYLFLQRVVILFSLFYWAIVCLYPEIGVYFSMEGLYSVWSKSRITSFFEFSVNPFRAARISASWSIYFKRVPSSFISDHINSYTIFEYAEQKFTKYICAWAVTSIIMLLVDEAPRLELFSYQIDFFPFAAASWRNFKISLPTPFLMSLCRLG